MAKIIIPFNNKDYSIDESALSEASAALKSHLSTVMNGTGATINLDGVAYGVDSAKLATATSEFVSHLGTIAGNGYKVKVGGVEYGVGSDKMDGAVSELEVVLSGLNNPDAPSTGDEILEGDGQEFHKFAPTALTFRSTEPLDEFQEVRVNGEVIDPSNYTLEEGSTIVKLSIDYLKTLPVGGYSIEVASANNAPSGDFTVTAPELNEHGFYYNQPYTANVPTFGGATVFFLREDGTMDVTVLDVGYVETCSYAASGNNLTINAAAGTFTGTASETGIYCNELYTNFVLGNTSIAADNDYIYIYKEDLGGYEVKCIDKTQSSYGAIKTGINGIDTIKLADDMFFDEYTESGNVNMTIAPQIPNTVTVIGQRAFGMCANIETCKIPDSVTSIGYGAFANCKNLEGLEIGNGVTNIDNDAFMNCINMKNIYITDLSAWCNILFGNENSNPTNGISELRCTVYLNDEPMTELIIPDGVTTLYPFVFNDYTELISVVIPDSVTSIGYCAFDYCRNLTSVVIPDSVTSIGYSAFGDCINLTSITIPYSVTSIDDRAFNYCSLLTGITFNGTTAQWNAITKGLNWNHQVPATYVQCSDGQVSLA